MTYHHTYGGGSITVWRSIFAARRIEWIMLINNANAVVLLFANYIADGLVFVDDNMRPHKNKINQWIFRKARILRIFGRSQS